MMLASRELLMLHPPKTGGTSLDKFLRDTLPFAWFPGSPDALGVAPLPGAWPNFGIDMHCKLAPALAALNRLFGWTTGTFQAIIVPVRNPYDNAAAAYFYQRHLAQTQGYLPQAIYQTLGLSFLDWLRREDQVGMRYFFPEGLDMLSNLRVLRFERIAEEAYALVEGMGFQHDVFPHLRRVDHPPFASLYDSEAEAIVYDQFGVLFDLGLYQRREGL